MAATTATPILLHQEDMARVTPLTVLITMLPELLRLHLPTLWEIIV